MTHPPNAPARSSTTWYTGLGLVEDAAQISAGIRDHSWIDSALGGAGAGLDTLGTVIDPLGSLVAWGVAWGVAWLMEHVRPLREALDRLAGNPDAVAAHATAWRDVSTFTAGAGTRYADAVHGETAGWRGDSGDAYRQQADVHIAVMRAIARAADGIAYAVEGAGVLVGLVRGIVRDLIAQFVATLAARLPQWLAEEGLTLGLGTPIVIEQVATLVAEWAAKIQHFVRRLLDSLHKLTAMIGKLGRILEDLTAELVKLRRSGPSGSGVPGSSWHQGDPVPPPRTGDDLPAEVTLSARFTGENDPGNPNRAFHPSTVHYLTPEEREAHRLFVDGGGNLRSARDGSLFDTAYGSTCWSGDGRAIFVMDGSGNLYASLSQEPGRFHHSSLLAGQPVAGAGEIEVRDGTLVAMTDQSGHYRPTARHNDAALRSLRDQGVVTDPGFKQYGWNGEER